MAAGDLQAVDSSAQIANVLAMLKGSKTTQTTGSNISSQGMQALLDQMLASSQGLGAISGQQKAAGMYGSTVNKMQMADFMTRAAGQLEAQRAGTTTTTKTPSKVSGKELLTLMALQGGNKLLGPTFKGIGKKIEDQGYGEKIADYFGFGSGGGGGGGAAVPIGQGISYGGGGAFSPVLNTGFESIFAPGAVDTTGASTSFSPTAATSLGADMGFAGATGLGGLSATYGTAGTGGGLGIGIGGSASSAPTDFSFSSLGDASTTASAATTGTTTATSSGGSTLGYIGSGLEALNAYKTNKDYRKAAGSAILNYFGMGAATPLVAKVAEPISNNMMREGEEFGGVGGAIQAEPIGSALSGRYNESDILRALSDPADLFGGNEGGSAGFVAAAGLDPIGTLLGGKGLSGTISDTVNDFFSGLGSLFSDERLKTDIKEVGATKEGQTIYTFKYKGDPIKTHMGVMAQETLEFHPEAVHKHPSGALMVDYDRILGVD